MNFKMRITHMLVEHSRHDAHWASRIFHLPTNTTIFRERSIFLRREEKTTSKTILSFSLSTKISKLLKFFLNYKRRKLFKPPFKNLARLSCTGFRTLHNNKYSIPLYFLKRSTSGGPASCSPKFARPSTTRCHCNPHIREFRSN